MVMYLMKKYSLTYSEANELLSEKRMQAQINLGFESQLLDFEDNKWEFDSEETIADIKRKLSEQCAHEMNLEVMGDDKKTEETKETKAE